MKTFITLLVLLSPIFPLSAQTPLAQWKLTGIMVTPGQKQVLLQENDTYNLILGEGQSADGATVVQINPPDKAVSVRDDQTNITFNLGVPGPENTVTNPYDLTFDHATFRGSLEVYARLINRNLLIHPDITGPNFSAEIQAPDKATAIQQMEKILADRGIAIIPDGKKFMLLVPASLRSTIKPAAPDSTAPDSESILPGLIDFQGVDAVQLAEVYAKLLGGQIDRSTPFPPLNHRMIYFETVTPMSREEARYACCTLLSWENLKLESTDNGLFKMVTISN